MATVNPTIGRYSDDLITFTWELTSTNRDGAPITPNHINFADRTYTVRGTWGGANVVMQGSNDGTNWLPSSSGLKNLFGTAISTGADAIGGIGELPLYIRPYLDTAGSGATLTVVVACRKGRSGISAGAG